MAKAATEQRFSGKLAISKMTGSPSKSLISNKGKKTTK